MAQRDTWSAAISEDILPEEQVSKSISIFAFAQIIVALIGIGTGFLAFINSYNLYVEGRVPLVGALGAFATIAIPMFVVGLLLVRIGLDIRKLETYAFSWVIYGNLIMSLLTLLAGGIFFLSSLLNILMLVLLFVPSIKVYWWDLFREDMGPRAKETKYMLYLIRRSPLVVGGVIIIVVYVLLALLAPYITPFGPTERSWYETLRPPSETHPWGTDQNGGDVYSMVIWATQIDLKIAISVVAVALVTGSFIGAAAGYFGGAVDEVVMRITDVFFAFPGLILAMAIVAALGQRNLDNISIALMLVWWPTYARLVRGQVLLEREKLYVEAARSVGASDMRILVFHILPNTIQPVIVQATLDMGGVLLTAAGLSFIGFGAEAGTAEWGLMISQGQNHFTSYWVTFYPGMAILLCALSFNLVGDGIRDILDPKLRRR
ncbi:MAG: ABC transporter permease [Candidatus Thorarchaeota archaeon]